jgi:hypothetical protein
MTIPPLPIVESAGHPTDPEATDEQLALLLEVTCKEDFHPWPEGGNPLDDVDASNLLDTTELWDVVEKLGCKLFTILRLRGADRDKALVATRAMLESVAESAFLWTLDDSKLDHAYNNCPEVKRYQGMRPWFLPFPGCRYDDNGVPYLVPHESDPENGVFWYEGKPHWDPPCECCMPEGGLSPLLQSLVVK